MWVHSLEPRLSVRILSYSFLASNPGFLFLVLSSCETKSGMGSLGSRLVGRVPV